MIVIVNVSSHSAYQSEIQKTKSLKISEKLLLSNRLIRLRDHQTHKWTTCCLSPTNQLLSWNSRLNWWVKPTIPQTVLLSFNGDMSVLKSFRFLGWSRTFIYRVIEIIIRLPPRMMVHVINFPNYKLKWNFYLNLRRFRFNLL